VKTLITMATLLWTVGPAFAQAERAAGAQTASQSATRAQAQPASPAEAPAEDVHVSGSLATGVQQFDNSTNSSKLTEYRDLRDDVYLASLGFTVRSRRTGWYFDLTGFNVSRGDQTILASGGQPGTWGFEANWIGVPHNFSNKAATPFIRRAAGLFEVPDTVPITFKKLATSSAADVPGVLASDALVAAYQNAFLALTPLATQTDIGHFSASWAGSEWVTLGLVYDLRDKSGLKSAYGPIGDRPPRTLNIQLTEPVDYRTNDLTFSAEHQGDAYTIRGEYLLSDFANRIDTLTWENVFATPAPGASADVWDRSVSAFGVRPLPPDNRYHNLSGMFGGDLPMDSRLTATLSYGRLEQNESLLPYSYNIDQVAVKTLPRATADALVTTTNVTADYVLAPVPGLNVRAFYRRFDLNNQTPSSRWQYVTSDTSNLNGTVSYVNKRVSLPFAFDRQNAGADATWRLLRRSSLTLGYEFEGIGRDHREADTNEHIFRAGWRTRAAGWASVQARYFQGVRDGGVYDNEVTHEGYWYGFSEANDNNNPALTFDNHPDMRRFDVSDRQRRQFDFRVSVTPGERVALSGYVRYRTDDFDSDVASSQPLLGTGLADQAASTPGDQLGALDDSRTRFGGDVFVQPTARVSLNAFLNYDKGTAFQRGLEFNENNKANPGAIATAELGPWTRASNQWTADIDDRAWNAGVGATLQIVPDRVTLITDYTVSLADIDITYGGYGVTNFDGTPFPPNHQFAFSSPPTVTEDLQVLNVRVEVPLRAVLLIGGYTYEHYTLEDWQQGSSAPWVEAVGADTLLRDSSQSYQWGNRLFNLGTYLAPGYAAHIGFLGVRYRF
jgi:MtrB/PioB family decaheme-associated outer membrane protein